MHVMQQFINWGGETPEQIAERRRFEEEMREFMINKMLMESGDPELTSTKAIYLFNETGYARKDIVATEGWNFIINDYAWWD